MGVTCAFAEVIEFADGNVGAFEADHARAVTNEELIAAFRERTEPARDNLVDVDIHGDDAFGL